MDHIHVLLCCARVKVAKQNPFQNTCYLNKIFSHGLWLASGCVASHLKAMFENYFQMAGILLCNFLMKHALDLTNTRQIK